MSLNYTWHFEVIWQYKDAFVRGFITTIELSLLTIAIALILGTALAVIRVFFPNKEVQKVAAMLIEILRAFPKIVVLIWIFYAFPILSGIQLPAFESAVVGLSIISSAFIAEVLRTGIEAIPKGQIEAAKVLGMNNWQIIISIILPQAFMRQAPSLMGECCTIIKDSTLAIIIGVNELLHVTSDAAILSYRPMELYTVLGVLFLIIILPLSFLSKKLEFKERIKTKA